MNCYDFIARCTPGLEFIAKDEIVDKIPNASILQLYDGYVNFTITSSEPPDNFLLALRSVENISLTLAILNNIPLKCDEPEHRDSNNYKSKALHILKEFPFKIPSTKWDQVLHYVFQRENIMLATHTQTTQNPLQKYNTSLNWKINCERRFPLIHNQTITESKIGKPIDNNTDESESVVAISGNNQHNNEIILPVDQVHLFHSPEVTKVLISSISTMFPKWHFQYKDPRIQINLTILGRVALISVTLLDNLHHRNRQTDGFSPVTALNPCTAYSLAKLANIQDNEIILDPMAGIGTICIEASLYCNKQAFYYNGDFSKKSIQQAAINTKLSNLHNVENIALDARLLPFKSNSIDKIISDPPFGNRHGNHQTNMGLYSQLLRSSCRVLKLKGLAFLLTADSKLMARLIEEYPHVKLNKQYIVSIGGSRCIVFEIEKVSNPPPLNELQLKKIKDKIQQQKAKKKSIEIEKQRKLQKKKKSPPITTPAQSQAIINPSSNTSTNTGSHSEDAKDSNIDENSNKKQRIE